MKFKQLIVAAVISLMALSANAATFSAVVEAPPFTVLSAPVATPTTLCSVSCS